MVRFMFWSDIVPAEVWLIIIRAALHAFQNHVNPKTETSVQDKRISDSAITSYYAIEKRDGLVAIGKRLLQGEFQLRFRFIHHVDMQP